MESSLAMNVELFANWLAAIRQLTRDQRRHAYFALALGEAADDECLREDAAVAFTCEPIAIAEAANRQLGSREMVRTLPSACNDPAHALGAAARTRVDNAGLPALRCERRAAVGTRQRTAPLSLP